MAKGFVVCGGCGRSVAVQCGERTIASRLFECKVQTTVLTVQSDGSIAVFQAAIGPSRGGHQVPCCCCACSVDYGPAVRETLLRGASSVSMRNEANTLNPLCLERVLGRGTEGGRAATARQGLDGDRDRGRLHRAAVSPRHRTCKWDSAPRRWREACPPALWLSRAVFPRAV